MRLHRFYIGSTSLTTSKSVTILEERLLNQWKNVFRYKPGDRVVLFNGNGSEYEAEIDGLDRKEARLTIVGEKEGVKLEKNITLYQSLIKKDNMEWVVEKATELGVSKIVPIISERSEKKGFNIERANKISVEASEQCGRGYVPVLENSKNLVDSIKDAEGEIIVFDTTGEPFKSSLLTTNYQLLSIFIGPEGGWSEKELQLFKEKGANIYSMGPLTLRAETAVISALSKFL